MGGGGEGLPFRGDTGGIPWPNSRQHTFCSVEYWGKYDHSEIMLRNPATVVGVIVIAVAVVKK